MKKPLILLIGFILVCNIFTSSAQQIQINLSKEYQTIDGFGGFGAKKVWWDGGPYYDTEYLNTAMDDLGCTIFRTQLYFDFESANDNNDPNVLDESKLKFGATSDNGKQFEFLKAVAAKGGKIIVSVWTPPSWMKDFSDSKTIPDECYNCWNCPKPWTYPIPENRKMCGGVLSTNMYQEYAEYLAAYVKIVKRQTGIDIYALSIQNEALFANPFESNVMGPKPYAEVLKVVGERFKKEGLTTKFFGPEHMAEYSWGGNRDYMNELFNNSTSGKDYLSMFAVHGYSDGVANDFGTATGWTDLYTNATVKNGKPIWMTETGNEVANTFSEGFKFARGMHVALKFGHISGWVFWALSGNALNGNKLTHCGAAMRNYYKFIKQGYIAVDASTSDAAILVTAYKKGKSLVVVAINNSSGAKTVQLNTGTSALPSSFNVHRYSATEMSVALGSVSNNSFSLPANSVTTMVYEDKLNAVENLESVSEHLNIYPTEVYNGQVNIEYTGLGKVVAISMFSTDGRLIQNFNVYNPTSLTLNTEGMDKGLYVLKINTTNGVHSKKINIQ